MNRWVLTSDKPPGAELGIASGTKVFVVKDFADYSSALTHRHRLAGEGDARALEIRDASNSYELAELHTHAKEVVVNLAESAPPAFTTDAGRTGTVVGCADDRQGAEDFVLLALTRIAGAKVVIVDRDSKKVIWPESGQPATAATHLKKLKPS